MHVVVPSEYQNIHIDDNETALILCDHLGGFSSADECELLDNIIKNSEIKRVYTEYIFSEQIKKKYFNLELEFSRDLWMKNNFIDDFAEYSIHPHPTFQNFVCSFNGSPHVSRKLLVSILQRFGYFKPEYSSKNFVFTTDIIDGHIDDYADERFYRKFFISDNSEEFFNTVYSFGHVRFDHQNNISHLESKLSQSFLHVVSETMATSYCPFVTEKFLYSVVTRGLFLAYAQPGWHSHLEKYFGFKRYTKIFDYRFDDIQNPIERLVELITMISKFSMMSSAEWQDLYLIEKDTIDYNYEWYFSKNYLKQLAQFSV